MFVKMISFKVVKDVIILEFDRKTVLSHIHDIKMVHICPQRCQKLNDTDYNFTKKGISVRYCSI